jgi:hypothetical protein
MEEVRGIIRTVCPATKRNQNPNRDGSETTRGASRPTLRRSIELSLLLRLLGRLAPGLPGLAVLKRATARNHYQSHQEQNRSRRLGYLFLRHAHGLWALKLGSKPEPLTRTLSVASSPASASVATPATAVEASAAATPASVRRASAMEEPTAVKEAAPAPGILAAKKPRFMKPARVPAAVGTTAQVSQVSAAQPAAVAPDLARGLARFRAAIDALHTRGLAGCQGPGAGVVGARVIGLGARPSRPSPASAGPGTRPGV